MEVLTGKKDKRKSITVILFAALMIVTLTIAVQAIAEEDFVFCNDSGFNVTDNLYTGVPVLSKENRALIEGVVVNEEVIYAHWNSWESHPEPNVLLEAGYKYEVTFVSDNNQGIPGWNYNGGGAIGTSMVNPYASDYVIAPGPCWITLYDPDYSCWHGLPKEAIIEDFEFNFAVEPGKSVVTFTITDGATTFYNTDLWVDNSGSAQMIIVRRPIIEDTRKYAPNLWFGSTEELYPTSPFFDDDDLSGEDNKNDYYALSFDQKMNDFVVYYHTVDTGEEMVYEYWFYYAYNNWVNKHYHDWETVYVFVNKSREEITRVVASAHVGGFINNMLEYPQFAEGEHVGIFIEEGSHASCTDKYNDGTPDTTNIGAWGLKWGTVPSDYTGIKIPVVVGFGYPWNLITVWLAPWNQGEKIEYNNPQYTLKEIDDDFISKFGGLKRFDDPFTPIYFVNPVSGGGTIPVPVDGEPPTHPWAQTRYEDPYEIIPVLGRFITGTVSGSDTTGAIVVILSEEPYYTIVYENGNFLLNNIPYGVYDVVVNLDGHAPYKQRFMHKENTTLGVNGILYLIPEEEAFRIEGIAIDAEGNSIPNATINIYDESGTSLFTTLTDENGRYLITTSVEHTYTVEATFGNKTGTTYNVSGEPREVVNVDLTVALPVIWANSTTGSEAIRWVGSRNVVNGKVHSNDGIKIVGSNNEINGTISYVSTFKSLGSRNVYSPPLQVSVKPMPVYYDIEDYKPGGSEAIAAGSSYHFVDGEFQVVGHDVVLDGLYYITDDARLTGSNIRGEFTIVAEGEIDIIGSKFNCSACSADLQFFSNDTKFKMAVSRSHFDGIIYMPKGEIDISGSKNTLNSSLFGDTVKLFGSELCINARR